jgi:GNAT superfamily N-acetyltransferase
MAPVAQSSLRIGAVNDATTPEWRRDGYQVSTDRDRLDLDAVHGYLSQSYWARGIPRQLMEHGIANSIPFGLYAPDGAQVGFARVVSDRAQFAYLADVYVLPAHRGRGLGVWLVECVLAHPDLSAMRRWMLATQDAHELYRRFGFGPTGMPERLMFIERSPEDLWGRPDS